MGLTFSLVAPAACISAGIMCLNINSGDSAQFSLMELTQMWAHCLCCGPTHLLCKTLRDVKHLLFLQEKGKAQSMGGINHNCKWQKDWDREDATLILVLIAHLQGGNSTCCTGTSLRARLVPGRRTCTCAGPTCALVPASTPRPPLAPAAWSFFHQSERLTESWGRHASSCSFTPLWAQLRLCEAQRKELLVKAVTQKVPPPPFSLCVKVSGKFWVSSQLCVKVVTYNTVNDLRLGSINVTQSSWAFLSLLGQTIAAAYLKRRNHTRWIICKIGIRYQLCCTLVTLHSFPHIACFKTTNWGQDCGVYFKRVSYHLFRTRSSSFL